MASLFAGINWNCKDFGDEQEGRTWRDSLPVSLIAGVSHCQYLSLPVSHTKASHTKASHTKASHTKASHSKASHSKVSHSKASHSKVSHTKVVPARAGNGDAPVCLFGWDPLVEGRQSFVTPLSRDALAIPAPIVVHWPRFPPSPPFP